MPKDRYEIEGQYWLPISRAAQLLGTNAQGVRKLVADGSLDWRQTRANSCTFVVAERAITALRLQSGPRLKRSADPLSSPRRKEPVRRSGGSACEAHHLRLTLPSSGGKKPKPQ